MRQLVLIPLLLIFAVTFTQTTAQTDTCPALVQTALEAASSACAEIGRNQACYGNLRITAVPAADVTGLVFEQTGDIASVTDLQALQLSGMVTPDEWGVAVLALQANLPDTLPGQNVRIILFGDVIVENAGAPPAPTLDVTVGGGINVRGGPGTDYAIIGGLNAGDAVSADSRNAAGDWVRVRLPDDAGTGWLYVPLVTVAGDVTLLDVVDADAPATDTPAYGPMQAFVFSSGIGQPQCSEAPRDGLLIQTPQGAGQIELSINSVQVRLGSTVYVQAQSGGDMGLYVVEGSAIVTADDRTVVAPAGAVTTVPLDDELSPAGAPTAPQPYDPDDLTGLPVTVAPDEVAVAPPAAEATIADANAGVGMAGTWTGIDVDGSTERVTITLIEGGRLQFAYSDDVAQPCRNAGGEAWTGNGEGRLVEDNIVSVDYNFQCTGMNVGGSATLTYTYDPETDTLLEIWPGDDTVTLTRG